MWPFAWPVYTLVGVGLVGAALAQRSLAAGRLVQYQPVASALEPVVALAGPVFAEGLYSEPVAHLAQLAGLILLVTGVIGVGRFGAARDSHAGSGGASGDEHCVPVLASHG